jgi:hypothetical protein
LGSFYYLKTKWKNTYFANFSHVLLACEYKFMVDNPERSFVEERAAWVDVDLMVILECAVAFSGIFFGDMEKVSCRDSFSDFDVVFSARGDFEFVSFHDLEKLFAHILSSSHGTRLNVVLVAPDIGEVVFLPRLVDCKNGEMISFRLVEPCFLLVGNLLAIFGSVEDVGF